eukprot:CAMPEP_0170186762 /NCGR_PEP_ID=MMETSP0040_2-20121228/40096_2 /TAXON_ID=641309 /ORGANISM="Lotharella oceanica, Strain CCMP622" /LENGTH=182 /DNA_ID=CAMNT_0010433619 /DNA_START=103 /DNA_END=652 /DNA_ORIENTATION=-
MPRPAAGSLGPLHGVAVSLEHLHGVAPAVDEVAEVLHDVNELLRQVVEDNEPAVRAHVFNDRALVRGGGVVGIYKPWSPFLAVSRDDNRFTHGRRRPNGWLCARAKAARSALRGRRRLFLLPLLLLPLRLPAARRGSGGLLALERYSPRFWFFLGLLLCILSFRFAQNLYRVEVVSDHEDAT